MTFLHQSDKFIRTKVVIGQKFLKWSDDIKPKDDITPFDDIYFDFSAIISESGLENSYRIRICSRIRNFLKSRIRTKSFRIHNTDPDPAAVLVR